MNKICVYCGSSDKVNETYLSGAYTMGKKLAQYGYTLVYGAGRTGLMGKVADGVLDSGGQAIGIIPKNFNTPVLAHNRLTHIEVVDSMHLRKARMAELSDGFIALPGGFGTFEEFFEILTWAQIGLHAKPVGLLNLNGYYDPLMSLIEHAIQEGFIYSEHRMLLTSSESPDELLRNIQDYTPPLNLSRWVDRQE